MRATVLFVIALLFLFCGCTEHVLSGASRDVSQGEPTEDITVEKVPVKGFQLGVEYLPGEAPSTKTKTVEGELLAVEGGDLWLLDNGTQIRIPVFKVKEIELLDLYPPSAGAMGAWTTLGSLSAFSHGYWAIFSLPIWLLTGIPAIVDQSRINHIAIPISEIDKLYQYARYPQGMPKPKPLPSSNESSPVPLPEETVAAPIVAPSSEQMPLSGKRTAGAFLSKGQKALWGKGEIAGIDDKEIAWKAADAAAWEAVVEVLVKNGIKVGEGIQKVINETPVTDRRMIDPSQKRIFSVVVVPMKTLGLKAEEAEVLWKALVLQNP
jgi:hypothetical protein